MKLESIGYNIFFGRWGYLKVQEILEKYSKICIIVDENTEEYCLNNFLRRCNIIDYNLIKINSGEINKNFSTVEYISSKLIEFNVDRNGIIINLGGGVLSDIGGFTASIFKRGIDFINVPTTLLSMVDASIGGKTGINLNKLKNIVGTFYTPKSVIIDIRFLDTLSDIEIKSGYAEMIKHKCIKGDTISNNVNLGIEEIKKSISIKNNIVKKDLKENNIRKILNFGHTIGHSIESLFFNKNIFITHGNAIAIGMICEFYLSMKKGYIDELLLNDFSKKIISIFPKKNILSEDFNYIISMMKNDKKNNNNKVKFSLLDGKENFYLDEFFEEKDIISALEFYTNL